MVITKIRPMFSGIVTTKNKYAIDDAPKIGGVLVDPKKIQGQLKEYQRVVAVGPMVRDVKVGELVMINPTKYAQYKPYKPGDGMREVINGKEMTLIGYSIPSVEISGVEHLLIQESDVDFVIEDCEEEKPSAIIQPDRTLITN